MDMKNAFGYLIDDFVFHFQYLLSIKPILDQEKFERLSGLAEEFRTGLGKKLQRYLLLKSWWSTNYVSKQKCQLCN